MDLKCNSKCNNLIEFVCIKDSCQEDRFCCFQCIQNGSHKNHFEQIQKISTFLNLVEQQSKDYDDLINQFEQQIENINNEYGNLKKELEKKRKEIKGLQNKFDKNQFNKLSSFFFSFEKSKLQLHQLISESVGKINEIIANTKTILQLETENQQSICGEKLIPFKYELINQIKDDYAFAFAFNRESSLLVTGYESSKIKVFDFQKGQLIQRQELSNHGKRVRCIQFFQKSIQFISGSYDHTIILWETKDNGQFYAKQILEGHTDDINCLIVNDNEDLIISGSDDKTIRLWIKNGNWQMSQTLTYHNGSVFCISMNELQTQFISCAADNQIVISQKEVDGFMWNIFQTIKVEWGLRLCFISNNVFTYQSYNKKQMMIYEFNQSNQLFVKKKEIAVKSGNNDCFWYFPQKYIKSKQLLLNKNGSHLNLIKIKENGEFIQEQNIDFDDNYIHGTISADGEYLITWDCKTEQIQVRQYIE